MTWNVPQGRDHLKTILMLWCRDPKLYDWWPWQLLGVLSLSLIRSLAMALDICKFLSHPHVSDCRFPYSRQHLKCCSSPGWKKKWFFFQRAVRILFLSSICCSWHTLYVEGHLLQSAPGHSPPLANSPLGEWEGLSSGTHPLSLPSGSGFWADSSASVCSHAIWTLLLLGEGIV